MKQRFQRGDPDVFDLAWLDVEELKALQQAMLSNRTNEICAYWLRSLNEQAAIRARKLRIIPGTEARDPETQTSSNIRSANLMQRSQSSAVLKLISKPSVSQWASAFVNCYLDVAVRP